MDLQGFELQHLTTGYLWLVKYIRNRSSLAGVQSQRPSRIRGVKEEKHVTFP